MSKVVDYGQLVAARKACHLCSGLTNPADVEGGRFDAEHIGAWSLWQGNLDASLMVVGQDWGDKTYFIQHEGRSNPMNPTNSALVERIGIAGIRFCGRTRYRILHEFDSLSEGLGEWAPGQASKILVRQLHAISSPADRNYPSGCCCRPRRPRLSRDPSWILNEL